MIFDKIIKDGSIKINAKFNFDKNGKPYSLKDVPKEINMTKFKKLDTELTKFWKQMENSWITTKDINGKRFNWSRVDKEKRYGKVNEYIEYDSNGKFNFKKFVLLIVTSNINKNK